MIQAFYAKLSTRDLELSLGMVLAAPCGETVLFP